MDATAVYVVAAFLRVLFLLGCWFPLVQRINIDFRDEVRF